MPHNRYVGFISRVGSAGLVEATLANIATTALNAAREDFACGSGTKEADQPKVLTWAKAYNAFILKASALSRPSGAARRSRRRA